jgi:hypothetical protein
MDQTTGTQEGTAMKVIQENASINLYTGARSRRIVGDGESHLVTCCHVSHGRLGPREDTEEEQRARAEFLSKLIDAATKALQKEHEMTRCKFHCQSVTKTMHRQNDGTEKLLYTAEFYAVYDGSEENKQFFAMTPSGTLKLGVYKEDLFLPGKDYYLDLSAAEA